MKIKITKDIPGYKAGEIIETDYLKMTISETAGREYNVKAFIADGWAEEIKDDIDIEAIRKEIKDSSKIAVIGFDWAEEKESTTESVVVIPMEFEPFITAYRIVKAVIDQLNGDWNPDWNDYNRKTSIRYDDNNGFSVDWFYGRVTIIPICKDNKTAQKVIELVTEELKVLFGVK